MQNDVTILSAQFDSLPRPLGPGWVMRISGTAQNIQHVALPFVARMAEQKVESLSVSNSGDRFEGFLRRAPRLGDRLFVGYSEATIATSIVFQLNVAGPTVA